MKNKTDKRFIKSYNDAGMTGYEIIVDTQTGVNYLFHYNGYAGGMTPLLNADGTPVVTSVSTFDKDCD